MSWLDSVSAKNASDKPALSFFTEQAALAQLGGMSPLWVLFMGASTLGMAYWGMTRWMTLGMPEKIAAPAFKLRLVKSEPRPEPVLAIEPAPTPPAVGELKTLEPEVIVAEAPTAEVFAPAVAELQVPALDTVEPEAPAPKPAKRAPKVVEAKAAPVVEAELVKPPVAATKPKAVKPAAVADAPVAEAPTVRRGPGRPPKTR